MKNNGTNASLMIDSIVMVVSDLGAKNIVIGLPRKFTNKCVKKSI